MENHTNSNPRNPDEIRVTHHTCIMWENNTRELLYEKALVTNTGKGTSPMYIEEMIDGYRWKISRIISYYHI